MAILKIQDVQSSDCREWWVDEQLAIRVSRPLLEERGAWPWGTYSIPFRITAVRTAEEEAAFVRSQLKL